MKSAFPALRNDGKGLGRRNRCEDCPEAALEAGIGLEGNG